MSTHNIGFDSQFSIFFIFKLHCFLLSGDLLVDTFCRCMKPFLSLAQLFCCYFSVFDCNEVDICDDNADCIYSQEEQRYVCECVEGFSGDGQYCERYKRRKKYTS